MQDVVNRKVNYKLYPSKAQKLLLENMFNNHRKLYNALLEQRIYAWKGIQKSLSYAEQCKQITFLRKEIEEFKNINAQCLQETAKRLDKAYKAFFSRVKNTWRYCTHFWSGQNSNSRNVKKWRYPKNNGSS
ncbi:helix-turn-helix domain-containing protein [Fluviispira vulneris]|uniref:helix-turn-helix domain-containing protein n=1 Tax=Fluviispira vulneris TaxID=2763012 RepID=UPI0016490DB4|nr:helix-turn-helix domain-containing protein [Fluviispira vulneris]